jgi:hypothetical protein
VLGGEDFLTKKVKKILKNACTRYFYPVNKGGEETTMYSHSSH